MTHLRLAIIACACVWAVSARAQAPLTPEAQAQLADMAKNVAAHCFEQAPQSVLPMLSKNTRLDMIDYFEAGSDRPSATELDGDAFITDMGRTFVNFDCGEGVHCQMFVIDNYDIDRATGTLSPDYVIGLIETLDTPIPDSRAQFFNSKWDERKGVFAPPSLSDWMASKSKQDIELVKNALPFVTAEYSFDPATLTITATLTISRYFSPSDALAARALSLLKQSIAYGWDYKKMKFVMKK